MCYVYIKKVCLYKNVLCLYIKYIYLFILFSHLADAFIQSDLQMKTL